LILAKNLKDLEEKPAIKAKWLFLLLLIAFVPQLLYSWKIVHNSIMTDFYSRFLSTGLLLQNKSPYFSNDFYTESNNLFKPVNGVTATPFALWLQIPLAKMGYCDAKITWWIIEEILLFATTFFTCLSPKKFIKQIITILVALTFFCYSRNWWIHVSSGQYYIVFGFIFSITTYYYKKISLLPLLLFPLSTLLRPFFVLATIPFLLRNFRSKVKWLVTGFAFALITLLISGTYKLMPEYNNAMKVYSSEITGWANENTKKSIIGNSVNDICTGQHVSFKNFNAASLFSLQHYLKLVGISLTSPLIFTSLLFLFLCVVLIPLRKQILSGDENIIIASFLIYMFAELFTPANRHPYNVIQYLGIVGLSFDKANYKIIALMAIGLALNHSFPITFKYQRELGEGIFLVGIYLTLFNKKIVSKTVGLHEP
jgi:hypothetical protein